MRYARVVHGLAVSLSLALLLMPASAAAAQGGTTTTTSVWGGVYTAEQAARGKDHYELDCAPCHGPYLKGGEGPSLTGQGFLRNWLEDNVNNLFTRVHERMPADAPGSLSPQVSADILSYLLQRNGFPPGDTELVPDPEVLSRIRIEGKDGPGPVPNYSLVLVVGCLEGPADGQWTVTRASRPVRTRESKPGPGGPNPTWSFGDMTFELMDAAFAEPERLTGQAVEVRGFLIREPERSLVNVTSLHPLAPSCGPEPSRPTSGSPQRTIG